MLIAASKSSWESAENPTDTMMKPRPPLLLVYCHEETQNKVDGFLPVMWCLSAHHVGGWSDEEAGKEGS